MNNEYTDDEYAWLDGAELLLDGSRGIYLPQGFAESVSLDPMPGGQWSNIDQEDLDLLSHGPDGGYFSDDLASDDYWDVWITILDNARFTDSAGKIWYLNQDDDLFLVPLP